MEKQKEVLDEMAAKEKKNNQ